MAVVAAWGGCATARPETPAEVAAAQAEALRIGDDASAWALLSSGARARNLPLPDRAGVPSGTAREVERVARWTSAEGPLVLVRDAHGWRVRSGVLGLSRAATPAQALESLARAIETRDYGLLLTLLPAAERTRWTTRELATALEAPGVAASWRALASRIAGGVPELAWLDSGARVRAAFGGGVAVLLVREEDGWKILDVEPRAPYAPAP